MRECMQRPVLALVHQQQHHQLQQQ